MILLALGDLESAVKLLGQYESGHQMGQSDIAEAHSAVGAGTDFRRDAVASSDDDLKRTSALLNIRYKVLGKLLGCYVLASEIHCPDDLAGLDV